MAAAPLPIMTHKGFSDAGLHDYVAPREFLYDSTGQGLEDSLYIQLSQPQDLRDSLWNGIREEAMRFLRQRIVEGRIEQGTQKKFWLQAEETACPPR